VPPRSARSSIPAVGAHDVRAALARPDFYPDRPDHVDVHETHISWVFLVGDRAYKLKKSLVRPFLDYGTAQRRREMCGEEIRLNRRLAADLYLGVRAIAASADGLALAPRTIRGRSTISSRCGGSTSSPHWLRSSTEVS
jgi:aminoglycoside phosphotransferase family enzyme